MNKKVLYNINFTAFSTLLVTQLSNLGKDDKLKRAKKNSNTACVVCRQNQNKLKILWINQDSMGIGDKYLISHIH